MGTLASAPQGWYTLFTRISLEATISWTKFTCWKMQKSFNRVKSSGIAIIANCAGWLPNEDELTLANDTMYIVSRSGIRISRCGREESDRWIDDSCSGIFQAVSVSSDGAYIAVGKSGESPDLVMFNTHSGVCLHRFDDHNDDISAVCFTHDSGFILSAGSDSSLYVFDVSSGMTALSTRLPSAVTFSALCQGGFEKDIKGRPTCKYLAAGCGPKSLAFISFDAVGLHVSPLKVVRDFTCCVFSGDRDVLFAGTTSGDIVCVQVKSAVISGPGKSVTGSGGVSALTVSGSTLFAGGRDGCVCLFAIMGCELQSIRKIQIDRSSSVISVSVNTMGRLLVSTSSGSLFQTVTSERADAVLVAQCATSGIVELFSSNGSIFSVSNELLRWTPEGAASVVVRDAAGLSCAAASPLLCLAGTGDGRMTGFDMRKKNCKIWDFPAIGATKCRLTRSMKTALVSTAEGEVLLFDLRSRSLKTRLKEHSGRVTDLAFFPADESFAVSSGRDRSLVAYDLLAERQVSCHRHAGAGLACLALLVDQTTVATGAMDGRVVIFDLRVRDAVGVVNSEALCMSASGQQLVCGDSSGCVKAVDVGQRAAVSVSPMGHCGPVSAICFFEDFVVSGGADASVVFWSPETDRVEPVPSGPVVPNLVLPACM